MFLSKVYNLLESIILRLDRVESAIEEYSHSSQKKLGALEFRIDQLEKKIDDIDLSGLEITRTDDRMKDLIKQAMDEYKTQMEEKLVKKTVRKK